jgi:hypothetical protein
VRGERVCCLSISTSDADDDDEFLEHSAGVSARVIARLSRGRSASIFHCFKRDLFQE